MADKIDWKFTDYSEALQDDFQKQMRKALVAVGLQGEKHAKELCPVVTGRLKNSISNRVQEPAAYIGTNVIYAPFVELGTSRRKKKPYLKPAIQNYSEEYKEIFRRYFKGET